MKIIALVPMKHTSERIPGKNYRLFNGKPLYRHIILNLQKCPEISSILIDTDSEFIIQDVLSEFPDVSLINRPEELRGGDIPMNDILLHDVKEIDGDYYIQTHSTNPLLKPETISLAIKTFLKNFPIYDSLFSVTAIRTRFWDSLTRPINHNPSLLMRTQDLPPIFEENSCIYLFTRHILEQKHNRIGERPLMFEIDAEESWDIDEESDFTIAEMLFKMREKL